MVMEHHLRYFGDIEHHHCASAAVIHKPLCDWKQLPTRPYHTWLRAIESDMRPLNIGFSYPWKRQPLEKTGIGLWTQRCDTLCHVERQK